MQTNRLAAASQRGFTLWHLMAVLFVLTGASAVAVWLTIQPTSKDSTANSATNIDKRQAHQGSNTRLDTDRAASRPLENRLQRAETGSRQPENRTGAATAPPSSGAPVTKVDLSLRGIVARNDPQQSRALIAKDNQTGQPYWQGDEIQPDVKLQEIASDHVILMVEGRRETLYLNRTFTGSVGGQAVDTSTQGGTTKSLADGRQPLLGNILRQNSTDGRPAGLLDGMLGRRDRTDATSDAPTALPQAADGMVTDNPENITADTDNDDWEDEDDDWKDEDWEDEDDDWEDEDDDWNDDEDDF